MIIMLVCSILCAASTTATISLPGTETKSWYFEAALKPQPEMVRDYVLIDAGREDFQKVVGFYQHHPVPGLDIARVRIIYNPAQNMIFSRKLHLLNSRNGNSAFAPKWTEEHDPALRSQVDRYWKTLSGPYTDSACPAVKLLPLWHGTDTAVLDSIFRTGYANLAITDHGFFGKGIYSTHEAEYAFRVYSKGDALLLNWVAAYSAYPVIDGDVAKLAGRANYNNYDAHFIPVKPQDPHDPKEVNYLPCARGQTHTYSEMVVFDSGQCLPRYLIELQPTLPRRIVPSTTAAAVGGQTVIPEIARGYEEAYRHFCNGQLIYKKGAPEQIVLPIAALANSLDGTFDLSRCGDTGQYLQIATGYRKQKNSANANKIEIWITPRFLIEKELSTTARHFTDIMGDWQQTTAPVGIFWVFGGFDSFGCFDYLTTQGMKEVGNNSLYEIWQRAATLAVIVRPWTLPGALRAGWGGEHPAHPRPACDFHISFEV